MTAQEIDRARQLVQAAYDIILDYQKVQLLWVEENGKDWAEENK